MVDWDRVFEFIDENKSTMTWNDIGDSLNKEFGVNYSESAYRKPYTAFKKGVEYAYEEGSMSEQLERIATSRSKLKLERMITQKEKYITNQNLQKMATYSLFSEEVIDNIQKGYPKIEPIKLDKSDKSGDFYIFTIADLHYKGYENLDMIFSEFLSLILHKQQEMGFKKIIIAELGDTVEGATLRPSQLLAIKKGLIDQTLDVSRYYGEFLTELSKTLAVTFICVEESNHTQLRNLGTGRNELPTEDTMKVLSEFVKTRTMSNPNINVISDGEVYYKQNDYKFLFAHGHKVNKKNYTEVYETDKNKNIDYFFFGHRHHTHIETLHEAEGYNKKIIWCPKSCLESSDYEDNLLLSSAPAILFNKFNDKKGHIYSEELILEKALKIMNKTKQKVVK
jgi:hypothetical protein